MKNLKLILLLFLFSCTRSSVPNWFLKVDTNQEYFYGVGEGPILSIAKQNALSDMTSKIQSTVAMKTQYNAYSTSSSHSSSLNKDISVSADDIVIEGYEVVSSEKKEDSYFVKTIIRKSNIKKTYQEKLNTQINEISEMLSRLVRLNKWEQYKQINVINRYFEKTEKVANILNSISSENLLSDFYNLKQKIDNKNSSIKSSLKININSNDDKMSQQISSIISKNNINESSNGDTIFDIKTKTVFSSGGIQSSAKRQEYNTFEIKIQSADKGEAIMQHKCKIEGSIKVIDARTNDILDSKIIDLYGFSPSSNSSACSSAMVKFKDEIKDKKLYEFFE